MTTPPETLCVAVSTAAMPDRTGSDVLDEIHGLLEFNDIGHVGVVVQSLSAAVFVWFIFSMLWRARDAPSMRSVAVLVLGDVGRSPRMMYHAESFAKSGFETFVVGYEGQLTYDQAAFRFGLSEHRREASRRAPGGA